MKTIGSALGSERPGLPARPPTLPHAHRYPMFDTRDTIAAIATAPGEAGIAVVRLSGPKSLHVADRIFRGKGPLPSQRPSHTLAYGSIVDHDEILDEVLLLIMRAPRTYTCEDVVEIQSHGGATSSRRILCCVLDRGLRLAEPGEFTARAFLNGRLDLLQAEAVLDLIQSRSERAAQNAIEQMEGRLSCAINALYDQLLNLTATLEACLDFPEEDVPPVDHAWILAQLDQAQRKLTALLDTYQEGHLLRQGALVVISGHTNTGKSTMMNSLLQIDRAIVSPTPGTTRDTLEEGLVLNGFPLRLVDTAGLRTTHCQLEQEGIRRTTVQIERADVHLVLVDASRSLNPDERRHIEGLDPDRTVIVANKIDLGTKVDVQDLGPTVVLTCLLTGYGLDDARAALADKLARMAPDADTPHAAISERHRTVLLSVQHAVDEARTMLMANREDLDVPLIALLRSVLDNLGALSGRIYHDDLLNSVFSRFCIGK